MDDSVSPYLELPKRSQEEVRALSEAMKSICRPTPAQRWLGSDRVTNALAKFRKEDEADAIRGTEG